MENFNLSDLKLNLNVLNFLPDWVKVTSVNGEVIYANTPLINALNFDPQGMRVDDLKLTKFADIFNIHSIGLSMKSGDIIKSQLNFDGSIFDVSTAPITDTFGMVMAYIDIYRDMTGFQKIQNELFIKNKIMNKDLSMTKKIQESILPSDLNYGRIKVDYCYQPCEQLSGDIFDVIKVSRSITGAYICDVAGHGVPAAMITVFVRETMRSLYDYNSTAYDLSELHKRFLNLRLGMDQYLTMFYVLIDTEERTISYSNAGHNCPMILIRKDGFETISIPGKPICNYFTNIEFKEHIIRFNPGDKLLLFTDGIIESVNKNGEQFGIERVEGIVENCSSDILGALKRSVDYFNGGIRYDDMCAVLIEFKEGD
ncbi:MAG: serine/threonine-protein phosphatase [Ezakiella sp.]|nr:serine/threonine-protein phosphatase [Ezakiella sp.]MDD7472117.1 PP2C family protein-serine/threonine phosphatase [Bacillota bacterium]MDY3923724.1 PP2C family protein-serine/threonine phosphatase [Ezakiella sp.]